MDFNVLDDKYFPKHQNFMQVFSVIKEVGFGVDTQGNWLIVNNSGLNLFDKEIYDSSLLTLLELQPKILKSKIESALFLKKLPKDYQNNFPYNLVILNGLKSKSEYWINLALNWLLIKSNHNDQQMNKLLVSILNEISMNKHCSQKLRHAAMKVKNHIV